MWLTQPSLPLSWVGHACSQAGTPLDWPPACLLDWLSVGQADWVAGCLLLDWLLACLHDLPFFLPIGLAAFLTAYLPVRLATHGVLQDSALCWPPFPAWEVVCAMQHSASSVGLLLWLCVSSWLFSIFLCSASLPSSSVLRYQMATAATGANTIAIFMVPVGIALFSAYFSLLFYFLKCDFQKSHGIWTS